MATSEGKKSFTAELPESDYGRLVEIAAAEDSSVGRLIRRAVREFLDNYLTSQAAYGLNPTAFQPQPMATDRRRHLVMQKTFEPFKPEDPKA